MFGTIPMCRAVTLKGAQLATDGTETFIHTASPQSSKSSKGSRKDQIGQPHHMLKSEIKQSEEPEDLTSSSALNNLN